MFKILTFTFDSIVRDHAVFDKIRELRIFNTPLTFP